ncbi:peptide chain release factor I [Sphingomonas sp. Leaf33]|uniref:alternative ribosome rescue aminoacyl-tRNA hydrolase ArfB n=1 Tax=Sphingomonas sp. Leaf33 TaxID=1736215 RepID=UPI0006F5C5B7|nr:alternative ribosome rescue aminoacyl-tRNA hydrolase ArfB [Sphingomonas sp. Leaf33]KQN25711.1 peptide chain release factor I [Sphingomonas sp. Leaf33]
MPRIPVTRSIALDDDELTYTATRASGAGGQHVNTTDSAVILRFDVAQSPNLPDAVKRRLAALAGSRMTRDGVLSLRSEGSRSQHMNREDVLTRLLEMIREATIVPKARRPTKPGKAAKARRMDTKSKRSSVKALRGKPTD